MQPCQPLFGNTDLILHAIRIPSENYKPTISQLFGTSVQETHAAATHMNTKDSLIQTLQALLLHETSHEYQGLISKLMDTDYLSCYISWNNVPEHCFQKRKWLSNLTMFMSPIIHAYKHGSSINVDFQHAGK